MSIKTETRVTAPLTLVSDSLPFKLPKQPLRIQHGILPAKLLQIHPVIPGHLHAFFLQKAPLKSRITKAGRTAQIPLPVNHTVGRHLTGKVIPQGIAHLP